MEQYVRRDDLRLRSAYPSLETRIFEVSQERFLIYVQNPFGDRDALCREFEQSFRFIISSVKLSFEKPEKFIREIPIIGDSQIADNFAGIGWTTDQLYNILYSKFPFLESVKIDSADDGLVKIHFPSNMSGLYNSQLTSFLDSLSGNVIKFQAVFDSYGKGKFNFEKGANHVVTILPAKWNLANAEFEKRDEAFWFDNIKGLYNGTITKETILGDRSQQNSCYIKYSDFSNVNIRNGLLMFDHVYVELPWGTSAKDFCLQQQVSEDDLVSLVEQNRITFVTNQPAFRMDFAFLNDIYKMKPSAVLSRRALSALVIADLVEINKNYILSNEYLSALTPDLFSGMNVRNPQMLYNTVMWPRRAVRESFDLLTLNSSAIIGSLGINNCFVFSENTLNRNALYLELKINSEFVHIASALNAFYFPFWAEKYETKTQASIMYNMIKLFKSKNFEDLEQFKIRIDSSLAGKQQVPSIDLLEVDTFPDVNDILQYSENFCTSKNFNSLFSYLDSFPVEKRNEKNIEYNKSLKELKKKRIDRVKSMDLGYTFLSDLSGIPFLGTITFLARLGVGMLFEKNEYLRNKWNEIHNLITPQKTMDKQVVRFLSQISPVARLNPSR